MKLNPSISAIVWSLVSLYTVTAHAEVPTLFISEYLEGASNNKALELYNNTDSNLILDNYRIEIYFNGNTSAGATIKLSGTLAAGKTYVIAHSSASFADTADKTSGSLSFNGNDAVVLKNGDSILDSIGQIGSSDYWSNGSGTVSTQNMDLRRSATVTDIDPTDVFDPGAQWTDYSLDDFSDLGIYGADDGSNGDDGGDNPPSRNSAVMMPRLPLAVCKVMA
ncbi:lamin tail domain-containing protein [Shewanella dokdonensis]|uniref:Lamin tail domain-containing protein n=1 Tax=Shewanella dokdonensis TaxID=712036 RepID=A0ABX8DE54_9GAMM|nr:lamin tail domain-containing protein [Shewanella dokdonensis]QVK22491.1 lamin tail domain-containing protein [Shewanella dokdonensis]